MWAFVALLSLFAHADARPELGAFVTEPSSKYRVDTFVLGQYVVHFATGDVEFNITAREFDPSPTNQTTAVFFNAILDPLRVVVIPQTDDLHCDPVHASDSALYIGCFISVPDATVTIHDVPDLPWSESDTPSVSVRLSASGLVVLTAQPSQPLVPAVLQGASPNALVSTSTGSTVLVVQDGATGSPTWPDTVCPRPEGVSIGNIVVEARIFTISGARSALITSSCITSPYVTTGAHFFSIAHEGAGVFFILASVVVGPSPPTDAWYAPAGSAPVKLSSDGNGGLLAIRVDEQLALLASAPIQAVGPTDGLLEPTRRMSVMEGGGTVAAFTALFPITTPTEISFVSGDVFVSHSAHQAFYTLGVVFGPTVPSSVGGTPTILVTAATFFGGLPRESELMAYTHLKPMAVGQRVAWSGVCDGHEWTIASDVATVSGACVVYTDDRLVPTAVHTLSQPIDPDVVGRMPDLPGVVYHGVLSNGAYVGTAYTADPSNPTTLVAVAASGAESPIAIPYGTQITFVALDPQLAPSAAPLLPFAPSAPPAAPAVPAAVPVGPQPALVPIGPAPSLIPVGPAPSLVPVGPAPALLPVGPAPSLVPVGPSPALVPVGPPPGLIPVGPPETVPIEPVIPFTPVVPAEQEGGSGSGLILILMASVVIAAGAGGWYLMHQQRQAQRRRFDDVGGMYEMV